MPNYTVQDTSTGKKITFAWSGAQPPTDADMEEVFSAARESTPEAKKAPSYGEDVMSTLKGEAEGLVGGLTAPILHPIDTVTGLYNTVRHPIDTARGVGKVLTEGSAEDIGKLYGNVASGAILGKVAPKLPTAVSKAMAVPERIGQSVDATLGFRPTVGDIAIGTAKGLFTQRNPLLKPILQAITEEATQRAAALIDQPANVQAGFKAVSAAAAKRGFKLSSADLDEVIAALREPESVTLAPMEPDTWTNGESGAVPHARGSASYGPYGDLKAWLERRFSAEDAKAIQADPNVKALLDQFGRPIQR